MGVQNVGWHKLRVCKFLWFALAAGFAFAVGRFAFAFALGGVVVVEGFGLGTCLLGGWFVEAVVPLRVDDRGDLVGVVFVVA